MIEPKKIFVDTSAWLEYILEDEVHHKRVLSYFIREIKAGSKIFTSDYVLDEAYTRLLTGQSLRTAQLLGNKVEEAEKLNKLLILWTDETVFTKAWEYFVKFAEHELSFTDATIYAFAKDLRIDEILTLDQGFKKVGLTVQPQID